MNLIEKLDQQNMKETLPQMNVGDTVRVHVKIKEGARERIQVFEGTIIAKKHGGVEQTITVRRLSYGVGVEPGKALLSARSCGQGRQGQGKALIPRKGAFGLLFLFPETEHGRRITGRPAFLILGLSGSGAL